MVWISEWINWLNSHALDRRTKHKIRKLNKQASIKDITRRMPKHVFGNQLPSTTIPSSTAQAQWRRLPTRSATAGQRTAATSDEETAAAPEVGLGAGASAAKATPAKEDTATAAATATYKILEAMTCLRVASFALWAASSWNATTCERSERVRGVVL